MMMMFLERKADRPRWPGVAVLALVTILLGACGSVAELDEEEVRVEVTTVLERYLPKLAEAHAAGDPSLLVDVAVEKERAALDLQLQQNADRGERLRPVLRQLAVDDVTVSRTTAYVNTTELWDIDRLALGSEAVIQSYPRSRFKVRYQLKKDEGAWKVFFRQSEPLDG